MDLTFVEDAILVDGESHIQLLRVFPKHLVITDQLLGGVAAVFGGGGVGRYMPFHVGCAGHEGDVVEVVDGEVESEFRLESIISKIGVGMRGKEL